MALAIPRTAPPVVPSPRPAPPTPPAPAVHRSASTFTSAPTSKPAVYVVRAGDTFSGVAARHQLTTPQLAKLNPQVKNLNLIDVGQRLHLKAAAAPPRPTYTVKSGDTFSAIAASHQLTTPQLARLNPQVKNLNVISVGQKLFLEPSAPAPAPHGPPSPPPPAHPAPTRAGLPDTSGLSTSKRFALYEQYIGKFGDAQAKKDLAAGKRVILSLRQDTPMTANQPYRGTYDDRIVVLWRDGAGPHVQELRANTEPNRRWSIPANESSKPVGRLADDQTIRYHKAWSTKFGNHLVPSGNPYAQRDANRDYRFEKNEKAYNGEWGGQAMFIHRAWSTDTGSQGCQTMDEGRFNTFWSALGSQRDVSYVLVNVTRR
ncbi:MAG: LysM peptidoglycan-binding domain-containing protein [Myxococcus sp.]|nr:LysM peptidoglycan-binding domain-containing protein [Myxococcus sp.]